MPFELARDCVWGSGFEQTCVGLLEGAWQDGTCVMVGDDHALVAETGALARKAIGCRLYAARPFDRPSGHLQHDFNEAPVRSRCAATHHLMADIELLAHTDFFVGAGSTAKGPGKAARLGAVKLDDKEHCLHTVKRLL